MFRKCDIFLDIKDLIDGNCPYCGTSDDIYLNNVGED